MDLEIVRVTLSHMIFFKVISLIDLFQFSNIYSATENITQIAFDKDLQARCLKYVLERSLNSHIVTPTKITEEDKETDFDICI